MSESFSSFFKDSEPLFETALLIVASSELKWSIIAPSMAGFITCQSRSSGFVIVIKSLPKKTPLTPSKRKSLFANGESAASSIF